MTTIRFAGVQDVPALMGLYHALSENYNDNSEALLVALRHSTTFIFVAEEDGQIAGTAAVSFRAVPSYGLVAYVDDVVASPAFRGRGIGKLLSLRCVEFAKEMGCLRIELTSRDSRVQANRLYQDLGFQKRETNFYVLKIAP